MRLYCIKINLLYLILRASELKIQVTFDMHNINSDINYPDFINNSLFCSCTFKHEKDNIHTSF